MLPVVGLDLNSANSAMRSVIVFSSLMAGLPFDGWGGFYVQFRVTVGMWFCSWWCKHNRQTRRKISILGSSFILF